MDSGTEVIIYVVGLILSLLAFFAILRLFSIDATLKQILSRMPALLQGENQAPIERIVISSTDEQFERALKGKSPSTVDKGTGAQVVSLRCTEPPPEPSRFLPRVVIST